jgi:uncharacterized protein (TIGR02466 family)
MADVKNHVCFPTLVHEFKLDITHDKMIDYIYSVEEETLAMSKTTRQSSTDLHKYQIFKPLVNELDVLHVDIIRNLEYKYDQIEITNMWSNHMYSGDAHPPHTHSNNFLSGVYYLQSSADSSPIHFFDPRAQSSILVPRREKVNRYNSNMLSFIASQGTGLIFPSWLQHWVPPTQCKRGRISLSWNIILRGDYGDTGTFQNAYI